MPARRCKACGHAATLLVLTALVIVPAHAAKPGVVIKLSKGGALGKAAAGVVLVDAGTSEVVAGATFERKAKARLVPTSGVYMAVATVASGKGTRVGVSRPFAYAGGESRKLGLPVAPEAGVATGVRRGTGASRGVVRGVASGDVAAMNGITITHPRWGQLSLSGPYLSVLFDLTKEKCGLRWVERSPGFRMARERELQLQREGKLDPSTPIIDNLLMATAAVEGELVVDGRTVTGELRLVDDLTGEVRIRFPVEGKLKKLLDLVTTSGAAFAELICNEPPPPPGLAVEIRGLPAGIDWRIEEDLPPEGGPRISCPPTCFYASPNGPHGITRLRAYPTEDPRTGDFPFDIESMEGCRGTSALPASNGGFCSLEGGESRVVVNLRYRPILAVVFAGEAGVNPTLSGNPVDGFPTDAVGFACRPGNETRLCARHYTPGGPVRLQTSSRNGSYNTDLVSWDGPCSGQGLGPGPNVCSFTMLPVDTCITATYQKSPGTLGPPHAISSAPCPTGSATR